MSLLGDDWCGAVSFMHEMESHERQYFKCPSFVHAGCVEIVLAFGAGYNRGGCSTVVENLKAELDAAQKSPPDERRQLKSQYRGERLGAD
jgi:hypothetical protein